MVFNDIYIGLVLACICGVIFGIMISTFIIIKIMEKTDFKNSPNAMLCGSADQPADAPKTSATQAESAAAKVRQELL